MHPAKESRQAAVTLLLLLACSAVGAREFHVATDGNDTNPGTRDRPFATLERARDAVREAKKTARASITVYLRGGTYRLKETVVFGLQDSAPDGHTITYRASPGEKPV
ncbi:MAG: right-handed parallel beta-helix repeat-containing protein, partial [Planctomycetota bacterium]